MEQNKSIGIIYIRKELLITHAEIQPGKFLPRGQPNNPYPWKYIILFIVIGTIAWISFKAI